MSHDGNSGPYDVAKVVDLIKRQYFQLRPIKDFCWALAGATWGMQEIYARDTFQAAVYADIFSLDIVADVPPSYTSSVLKALLERVTIAVQDSDSEDAEISGNLLAIYTDLLVSPVSGDARPSLKNLTARHSALYAAPSPEQVTKVRYFYRTEAYVTIREARSILVAEGTTGHRTWEAAMALGEHLLAHEDTVSVNKVLELGAGTGFLSLLCGKLGAREVFATDGNTRIVSSLARNICENDLSDTVKAQELWFGSSNVMECDCDLILGADITYDEGTIVSLVETLSHCLESNPKAKVLISATVRRQQTYLPQSTEPN